MDNQMLMGIVNGGANQPENLQALAAGELLVAYTDGVTEAMNEDSGEGTVDFHLPYGEWIRLFREHGFVVEDLLEPRPAADATSSYRDELERDWSRRWPAESIWRLRRS